MPTAPKAASGTAAAEERWVTAADGWRLSVLDVLPADLSAPKAVAVVGHAMMVDRRTVFRPRGPCLTRTVAEAGMRVLVPDLRGHGHSGPTAREGGSWTYDQLVSDVGCYIELARSLEPELPLFLLGNSLFGHNALAYLGGHPDASVQALVGLSMNIWNRRWTASRPRFWLKAGVIAVSAPVSALLGRIPCQRLGLGTMDEPADYWRCMITTTLGDGWRSDSGADYAASMKRIRCPLLHVLSDGDRLFAQPDDALLFSGALGRRREVLRLGRRSTEPSLSGIAPGHVELVSNPRCEPVWRYVAQWLLRSADREPGSP